MKYFHQVMHSYLPISGIPSRHDPAQLQLQIPTFNLHVWSYGASLELEHWVRWICDWNGPNCWSHISIFVFYPPGPRAAHQFKIGKISLFPFFVNLCLFFFVLFRLFYEAVAIHALIGGAAHGHCTLRSVWCAAAPIQGVISRIEIWQNIYQW